MLKQVRGNYDGDQMQQRESLFFHFSLRCFYLIDVSV